MRLLVVFCAIAMAGTASWAQKGKSAPVKSVGSGSSAPVSFESRSGHQSEVNVNLSQGVINSYKLGNNTYTDINFIASYSYLVREDIQVLAEGGLSSWPDSGTSNKTIITLMGGGTFNFKPDLTDSFFAQAAIGLMPAYDKDNAKYDSKFSFFAGFGKRFAIWNHVNYSPLVRIYKRGDMDMSFAVIPLNISLMF